MCVYDETAVKYIIIRIHIIFIILKMERPSKLQFFILSFDNCIHIRCHHHHRINIFLLFLFCLEIGIRFTAGIWMNFSIMYNSHLNVQSLISNIQK